MYPMTPAYFRFSQLNCFYEDSLLNYHDRINLRYPNLINKKMYIPMVLFGYLIESVNLFWNIRFKFLTEGIFAQLTSPFRGRFDN